MRGNSIWSYGSGHEFTRIESGWLYELNGRWLDEHDPRVIATKE